MREFLRTPPAGNAPFPIPIGVLGRPVLPGVAVVMEQLLAANFEGAIVHRDARLAQHQDILRTIVLL